MSTAADMPAERLGAGRDRAEAGLDRAFKALGSRLLVLALQWFVTILPEEVAQTGLRAGIDVTLQLGAGLAALLLAVAAFEARPGARAQGAPRLMAGALVALSAAAALELFAALDLALGLTDATASLLRGGRLALLAGLTILCAAAARLAHAAGAQGALRWLLVAQLAVTAVLAAYGALELTGLTAEATWATLVGLAALLAGGLAMVALHALAGRLHDRVPTPSPARRVDAPELDDISAARWPPRRVIPPPAALGDGDDDDDDPDGEPWVPREPRLVRAAGALPERDGWSQARDGLRLFLRALAWRFALAMFGALFAGGLFGPTPSLVLTGLVTAGLIAASVGAVFGLTGLARVPAATGARAPARLAGTLAATMTVADLLTITFVIAALIGVAPWRGWLGHMLLASHGLAFALLAVLLFALARLGARLRVAELVGRAPPLMGLLLAVAAGLVGALLLGRSPESEVANLSYYLGGLTIILLVFAMAIYLRLLHEAAEAIDDHIRAADLGA
ncbi:MAG: hypothetical protein CSA66_00770 [Proteobacteria bacterium]|nr:MAG: hypothetical protein CSA66_00770 [Pseudomonadota bacterium]